MGILRKKMIRVIDLCVIFFLLVATRLELFSLDKQGVLFSEARMEAEFEKCCGLGTSWALEGLKCEKFTGPVSGVPTVEQGLCLEAVDICCIRTYHEEQCKKGKLDAHAGLACVSDTKSKYSGPGDYHRDCCEACKLGILTGSMGQGCAFKKFTFGNPWDPAFLECCHEASPSTTSAPTDPTNATSFIETTDTSSSSISTSPLSTPTLASTSSSLSIPTPPLDDICQLMKGLLCSDICIPTPGSYYCKCREGFSLLEDGKTCRQDLPIDRCKSSNPCEQRCTDNGVAVTCSCNPGYILAKDKHSCLPETFENKNTTSEDDNEFLPLCPTGYRYNATNQVCDDVNECIEKEVCPGHCENNIGSYICTSKDKLRSVSYEEDTCPPGYQWEPATGLCTDIDECLILSEPCSGRKNFCVNTQGSFSCLEMKGIKSCPAGFKFNKLSQQCEDVNECAEGIHSCFEGTEECRNIEGAYECDVKCDKGFTYNVNLGTCTDVDECFGSSNPCLNLNTTCKNIIGGYECLPSNHSDYLFLTDKLLTCPAGYKPINNSKKACTDVDECKEQLHSCEENEQCINDIGSYRCEPLNHEDINLYGKIKDTQAYSYRKEHKLATSPVVNQATTCKEGFMFDQQSLDCIDIDECNNGLSNCGISEQCINFKGGYRCSPVCPPGFQLSNDSHFSNEESCQDINECALGLHSCNVLTQFCLNTNGSYTCEVFTTTTSSTIINRPLSIKKNHIMQNHYLFLEPCDLGYTRDIKNGECIDIDECATGLVCRDYEQCYNIPGSFKCSPLCTTGWYFNTAIKGCQDVDECLLGSHDCPQDTHKCINTNGSFLCELIPPCSNGYKRSFDDSCIDIDECLENLHTCRLELHQYCVNKNGSFECLTRLPSCSPGYEYDLATKQCEDVDECVLGQHKCDFRLSEKCFNLPGTYRCERPVSFEQRQHQKPACPSGFRYHPRLRKCTDIDECAEGLDSCEGEVCYNQPGGYSCATPPKPKTRKPPTTPSPTLPNKKCASGLKLVKNYCIDINECREIDDACSSNEDCINTVGSYTCKCKVGFRRENLTQACVDINECQTREDICLQGQRCDNTIGSYTCTRYLSCGTGYTLNAATGICEDDDECLLGLHDCRSGYQCRNTLGSFRCYRNPRIPVPQARVDTTTPLTTTTSKSTSTFRSVTSTSLTTEKMYNCPRGFEPGSGGKCVDIDECQEDSSICGRTMRCMNTVGSYRCVSKVICSNGFTLDPISGQYCIDIDECANGTHECTADQTCENRLGGYVCTCPPGHVAGPNKDCVDIDECSLYGNICGSNSQCENTVGSFRCNCESGFENIGGSAGGSCQDIDECQRTTNLCQHMCFNVWGSYRCACKPGFRLNPDNRSCTDVDECTEFKKNNLCIGICENTPGSYACKCPDGYKLGFNGRTCEDIDECQVENVCRGADEICHNTRGGFRCNKINCPTGYHRDHERKNRCVKSWPCRINDPACLRQPSHYSYNFITLVSMLPIAPNKPEELFKMKGYHMPGSTIQFSMTFLEARAPPGVQRATESCFALKRPAPQQAVLIMTRSIQGPQEIELDLSMEVYHNTFFAGSAVAKILIFVSQYEF